MLLFFTVILLITIPIATNLLAKAAVDVMAHFRFRRIESIHLPFTYRKEGGLRRLAIGGYNI
jgi:hypothetical protein